MRPHHCLQKHTIVCFCRQWETLDLLRNNLSATIMLFRLQTTHHSSMNTLYSPPRVSLFSLPDARASREAGDSRVFQKSIISRRKLLRSRSIHSGSKNDQSYFVYSPPFICFTKKTCAYSMIVILNRPFISSLPKRKTKDGTQSRICCRYGRSHSHWKHR